MRAVTGADVREGWVTVALKMMLVLAPACRVSISALYLVSTLCRTVDI